MSFGVLSQARGKVQPNPFLFLCAEQTAHCR